MHVLLEPIACYCFVQMAKYGAFEVRPSGKHTATAEEIELAESRQAEVDKTGGLWRTHFIYPERLWLYGVPGMFSAYFMTNKYFGVLSVFLFLH